jgi:predicted secreted protein
VAKYSGKDMVLRFGTISVAGAGRNFEVSQSADDIDVTSYGSAAKEFITGLVDRSATLEVLDDSTNTTIRNKFTPGSSDSLTWFPIGTASGNPKFAVGTAIVTEANLQYPYDDAVLMNVSMRLSGAVTESTASASGT